MSATVLKFEAYRKRDDRREAGGTESPGSGLPAERHWENRILSFALEFMLEPIVYQSKTSQVIRCVCGRRLLLDATSKSPWSVFPVGAHSYRILLKAEYYFDLNLNLNHRLFQHCPAFWHEALYPALDAEARLTWIQYEVDLVSHAIQNRRGQRHAGKMDKEDQNATGCDSTRRC